MSAEAVNDQTQGIRPRDRDVGASPKRIGILVFDGAEELDWAGPWEVLAAWSRQWPEDGIEVFTVAPDGAPVTCAKGLRILPDRTLETAPPMDLMVVPGGRGARPLVRAEPVLSWLRMLHRDGVLVTSVCTGALVLAAAGLLHDQPAATYWSAFDEVLAIDPTIKPRRDDRFVDNGAVITGAGISAGIDMALHLVARLHSVARAREVRRYIQYDPKPPV
jgi:transcriptional regulator GlxA family with amidase domain